MKIISPSKLTWVFGILIIVFLTWDLGRFLKTQIAPLPPLWTDQGYYLKAVHQYADFGKEEGWGNLILAHFNHQTDRLGFASASNLHMSFVTAFLEPFFGPSRLGVFALPIFSWFCFLSAFFILGTILFQSSFYGFLLLALAVSSSTVFEGAGSAIDFRMEFASACWGAVVLLCWMVLLTKSNSVHWKSAISATILLGFLGFFFRPITCIYWFPFYGFLFLGASIFLTNKYQIRFLRAGLGILFLATVVLLTWDRDFILHYYFQSFLNPAEISARNGHIETNWTKNLVENWQFYWSALVQNHLGEKLFAVCKGLILFGVIGFAIAGIQKRDWFAAEFSFRLRVLILPILLFFFPLLVLSLNPHRATQVAGYVAPIFLILSIAVFSLGLKRVFSSNAFEKAEFLFLKKVRARLRSFVSNENERKSFAQGARANASRQLTRARATKGKAFAAIFHDAKLLKRALRPILPLIFGLMACALFGWPQWKNSRARLISTVSFSKEELEVYEKLCSTMQTALMPAAGRVRDAQDLPQIAVLDWMDGFDHNTVTIFGRERGVGKTVFEMSVIRSIEAMSAEKILSALKKAQFVLVPEMTEILLDRPYPISRSVHEAMPAIQKLLKADFHFQEKVMWRGRGYDFFIAKSN